MKTKVKTRYTTVKLAFAELSYSSQPLPIEEVLAGMCNHDGWPTKDDLHAAIRRWADIAKPGDVFCTRVTAIIACR